MQLFDALINIYLSKFQNTEILSEFWVFCEYSEMIPAGSFFEPNRLQRRQLTKES